MPASQGRLGGGRAAGSCQVERPPACPLAGRSPQHCRPIGARLGETISVGTGQRLDAVFRLLQMSSGLSGRRMGGRAAATGHRALVSEFRSSGGGGVHSLHARVRVSLVLDFTGDAQINWHWLAGWLAVWRPLEPLALLVGPPARQESARVWAIGARKNYCTTLATEIGCRFAQHSPHISSTNQKRPAANDQTHSAAPRSLARSPK